MIFLFDQCRGAMVCQEVDRFHDGGGPSPCPGVVVIGGTVVARCSCPHHLDEG